MVYEVETKDNPTGKYMAMLVTVDGEPWFSKLILKDFEWLPDLLTHAYNKGVLDGIKVGSRETYEEIGTGRLITVKKSCDETDQWTFCCTEFMTNYNEQGKRYGGIGPDLQEVTPKQSAVDHPKHYTEHPSGIECIQITEHMGFNLGNAVKYIWRADLKGNAIEDLSKAIWYLQRELAKRSKASNGEPRN